MSVLSRVRPDEFTIAMLATVMLAFLLPCRGTSAGIFAGLAAGLGRLHLDRRRECRGGAVQRFGFEHFRYVPDAAVGRPRTARARRVFARCADIDRTGDAPSIYRRPAVAALDRELGTGTAPRIKQRRSRL